MSDELTGRVMRSQSGFYFVNVAGRTVKAVLRGRLKKERQETGLAALGDLVRLETLDRRPGDQGAVEAVITAVLPRTSVLARRAPGAKGAWAQDVIVANVDQLVPVLSVAAPPPNWRMLDRFLALAEIDEIDSVIVLNKIDLGLDAAVEAAVACYRDIGYAVLLTSATSGAGVAGLRDALAGRVSAVVGRSGVGKSALLNAVEPGLDLRVGAVSEALGKGRHTTRVGELHPLSGGGMVADTPGLREIGVWAVDPGELEWAFVEFRPFVNDCRFPDCDHIHEPGCAVRAAVERGDITVDRYESYLRLLADEER